MLFMKILVAVSLCLAAGYGVGWLYWGKRRSNG
jgi:hypothetical protein